jgi:hydroxymethylbilane synthase
VASILDQRLGIDCAIEVVTTRGDRVQDAAFRKMEGKGFFTKELQDALLRQHIDLVVHSLKDLPTDEPEGLEIIAIPERADPADMLLARRDLLNRTHVNPVGLPAGAVLGTSSLRRAAQVLALNPEIRVRALRGNVPTRISRLRQGDYDAILLAAAGVHRLGLDLEDLECVELEPEVILPAPGQGALAVEVRAADPLSRPLAGIHDLSVARCVSSERRLLELIGGGCHLPLGCLASEDETGLRLQAVLGEIDDQVSKATVSRVSGVAQDPGTAARVCYEALRLAMPEVMGA